MNQFMVDILSELDGLFDGLKEDDPILIRREHILKEFFKDADDEQKDLMLNVWREKELL